MFDILLHIIDFGLNIIDPDNVVLNCYQKRYSFFFKVSLF